MELVGGGTEVHGRIEQVAGVADPAARHHRRHIGYTQQLGGRSIGERTARRADPHAYGHLCVADPLQELDHALVADDGTAAVELQDQGLRPVVLGPLDGLDDRIDGDLIEEPRDLHHVDGGESLGRSLVVGMGGWGEQRQAEKPRKGGHE